MRFFGVGAVRESLMALMTAPRSLYVHNSPGESGTEMQAPAPAQHFFSPFTLGSFSLRALRRLVMAFNSLSAMAPTSFRFNASRRDASRSAVGESSASQPRLPLLWFPRFGRSVKQMNEVQKRRKLAMERFTNDEETGRKVTPFVNSRGQTLFSQSWIPVNSEADLKYVLSLLRFLRSFSFPILDLMPIAGCMPLLQLVTLFLSIDCSETLCELRIT